MQNTNKYFQNEEIIQNKNKEIKHRLDSETYEDSINDNNSYHSDIINGKIYKKSIDFFPKKMGIEAPDEKGIKQRKYSMENHLVIKDFVPQIKPIKINMVPSKFQLNKKECKDLKRQENINIKKYYNSCPNSEDEESDKNNSSKKIVHLSGKANNNIYNEHINQTRKIMQQTKNKNILKVNSINNFVSKKKYEKELNLGDFSDSDLFEIYELDDYYISDKKEEIESEEEKCKHRNRINSFSILEVLQKNYKIEDEL